MSLDNIQLSEQICQILFSTNLIGVESQRVKSAKDAEKTITIKCLGENQKNILFLLNHSNHKFLPDEEMDLLSKLITACKLSMADIALVNFNSSPFNYQEFTTYFQSKKILLFGVTPAELELPFNIPFFQIQEFHEQLYLTSPPLTTLINSTELKKVLWTSLQKLFLLK